MILFILVGWAVLSVPVATLLGRMIGGHGATADEVVLRAARWRRSSQLYSRPVTVDPALGTSSRRLASVAGRDSSGRRGYGAA